jgi:hypothetical protein
MLINNDIYILKFLKDGVKFAKYLWGWYNHLLFSVCVSAITSALIY